MNKSTNVNSSIHSQRVVRTYLVRSYPRAGVVRVLMLVVLLVASEHWLARMLVPMSQTRVTVDMYEEQSFLRKRGLLTFLRQILEPLDEFDIVLENSLTQGI